MTVTEPEFIPNPADVPPAPPEPEPAVSDAADIMPSYEVPYMLPDVDTSKTPEPVVIATSIMVAANAVLGAGVLLHAWHLDGQQIAALITAGNAILGIPLAVITRGRVKAL